MTQESPQTRRNSSAQDAEDGSGHVTIIGSHLEAETTSTVVDSGKIHAIAHSAPKQMRHEEYMLKKAKDELQKSKKKSPSTGTDTVKRPSHYNQKGIECIDAIHAALGDEGFINYCHGNCMKYTWRWQRKGGLTDLDKSAQYAEFIKNVSAGKPPRG